MYRRYIKTPFFSRKRRSYKGRSKMTGYRRKYSYLRKKGRFAGRYYRRVYKGGKYFRRYRKDGIMKKIISNKKAQWPSMAKTLDRMHIKSEQTGFWTVTWTGDTQSFMGTTIRMDTLAGDGVGLYSNLGPVSTQWVNGSSVATPSAYKTFLKGITDVFNFTTSSNQSRFEYAMVTGVKYTVSAVRQENAAGSDLSSTELVMIPLTNFQYTQLSPDGTGPMRTWPPSAGTVASWLAARESALTVRKRMQTVQSGKGFARISKYFSLKKFHEIGWPASAPVPASNLVWGTSAAVPVAPTTGFSPYVFIGFFNNSILPAYTQVYDITIHVKIYLTAWHPTLWSPYNLLQEHKDPEAIKALQESKREETKEEKVDEKEDHEDDDEKVDVEEVMKEMAELKLKSTVLDTKLVPTISAHTPSPPIPSEARAGKGAEGAALVQATLLSQSASSKKSSSSSSLKSPFFK